MKIFDRELNWSVFKFQSMSKMKYQEGLRSLGRWASYFKSKIDIVDVAVLINDIIEYPYRPYGYIGVEDKQVTLFSTPPPNIKILKDTSGYTNFLGDDELADMENAIYGFASSVHRASPDIVVGNRVFVKGKEPISAWAIVKEVRGKKARVQFNSMETTANFIIHIGELELAEI